LAIRTYAYSNGAFKLTGGDHWADLQQLNTIGMGLGPLVVTLITDVSQLAAVPEYTAILNVSSTADLLRAFNSMGGGGEICAPGGPHLDSPVGLNLWRQTYGLPIDAPGTERFVISTPMWSEAGLQSLSVYDGTKLLRRYALSGTSAMLNIPLLHDKARLLSFVLQDVNGKQTLCGYGAISDALMVPYMCGDRTNTMGAGSTLQDPPGSAFQQGSCYGNIEIGDETAFSNVGPTRTTAICDGGPTEGIAFGGASVYFLQTTANGDDEPRAPVHNLLYPYNSADVLVIDQPILERVAGATLNQTLNNVTDKAQQLKPFDAWNLVPRVPVAAPNIKADMTISSFYRSPLLPSPMMIDLTVTNPKSDTLTAAIPAAGGDTHTLFSQLWTTSLVRVPSPNCVIGFANGTQTSVASGGQRWSGTLHPGDFVLFPEIGEGFYVLQGTIDALVYDYGKEAAGEYYFITLGRLDTPTLPANTTKAVRLLQLKTDPGDGKNVVADWQNFRSAYGLGGTASPAYRDADFRVSRGTVVDTNYVLEVAADRNYGFAAQIPKTDMLKQRLPIKIDGLNPNWTAARLDLENNAWFPIPVATDAAGHTYAYTTIDTKGVWVNAQGPACYKPGGNNVFLGNVVTSNHPEVVLTLFPATGNADGNLFVDVYNPTSAPLTEVTVTVNVPAGTTYPAPPQTTAPLTVPALSTIRVGLNPQAATPAPTVYLTNPVVNGEMWTTPNQMSATYGQMTITANAAEPGGTIAKVDFYRNGALQGTSTAAPYSCAWAPGFFNPDISKEGGFDYLWTAVATDTQGHHTSSGGVCVIVDPQPQVSVTTDKTVYPAAPATITLTAAAQASGGQHLMYVSFYNGSSLLHTCTAAPYTFTWSQAPPGTHSLTAVASDNWDAVATSEPVLVTVNAGR
jgi:hypothetical protein